MNDELVDTIKSQDVDAIRLVAGNGDMSVSIFLKKLKSEAGITDRTPVLVDLHSPCNFEDRCERR